MQLKWPMLWDLFSLFPAYAGVIPAWCSSITKGGPFPRIRGGDPENMVYGGRQFSPMPNGATDPWNTCRNYTIDKSQLSLFRYEPWMICNRNWYWLRDVVSAAYFAYVDSNGGANCGNAGNAYGVRPVVGPLDFTTAHDG